jgi:peptidoglycan/xylan/chitin deacetylase (PgdA/CDA1 family)
MGIFSLRPRGREWILFPFYHWVLDDERESSSRQLRSLRQWGDFITLDQAVDAMDQSSSLGGAYFCLTFDDGFRNCMTNAVPVLQDMGIPAAFFVPTKFIGLSLDGNWDQIAPFYRRSWSKYRRFFEFLTWEDCRRMVAAGFTVGSHTHSHIRLAEASLIDAERELADSKHIIEKELGKPCRHFCCPWGQPGKDFDPAIHPELARRLGYASFSTTQEGANHPRQSPFHIRRNDVAPDQGSLLFRYSILHRQ